MKYRIKIIVGYRRDQEHSIPAAEAHKAYYLFTHPTERAIFSNGLAIKGDQIQEIVPDWHGTMGWNATHTIDSDDWNELRAKGIDRRMNDILTAAKDVARVATAEELSLPLPRLLREKYSRVPSPEAHRLIAGTAALADQKRV